MAERSTPVGANACDLLSGSDSAGCCALATSGHAATVTPSSVMKSRRFTR
jgi:uncharacterized protein YchJ